MAPKDMLRKEEQTGIVYHIKCKDCEAAYVGESKRSLNHHLDEHRRPSCVNSPVVNHVAATGHSIDWKEVKILDRDERWFELGVREAIHIKMQDTSLNRDGGRYNLPGVYTHMLRPPHGHPLQSHS